MLKKVFTVRFYILLLMAFAFLGAESPSKPEGKSAHKFQSLSLESISFFCESSLEEIENDEEFLNSISSLPLQEYSLSFPLEIGSAIFHSFSKAFNFLVLNLYAPRSPPIA
ncbi:MAG: hypothetical protein N3A69_01475 [Leptospiraceae bacterium]|nr:hypothetical protein [Leptospiraceae bacterium]